MASVPELHCPNAHGVLPSHVAKHWSPHPAHATHANPAPQSASPAQVWVQTPKKQSPLAQSASEQLDPSAAFWALTVQSLGTGESPVSHWQIRLFVPGTMTHVPPHDGSW